MKGITMVVMAAAVGLLCSQPALAEYYRYTDSKGVVRYTDNLSEVPPSQRGQVSRYKDASDSLTPEQKQKQADEKKKAAEAKKKPGKKDSAAKADTSGTAGADAGKTPDVSRDTQAYLEALAALDKRREALDAEYKALQAEAQQLEEEKRSAKRPQATRSLNQRIQDVNERIAAYEKKRQDYEKDRAALEASRPRQK